MNFKKQESVLDIPSSRELVGKKVNRIKNKASRKKRIRSNIVDMILKGVLEAPPDFLSRIK